MHKIYTWKGTTQNPPHNFHVEFYHDEENFFAKIRTKSLTTHEHVGSFTKELEAHFEEFRDNDLNQLRERAKEQSVSLGERILTLQEQPTEDEHHDKPRFKFDEEALKRAEQKMPRNWRED